MSTMKVSETPHETSLVASSSALSAPKMTITKYKSIPKPGDADILATETSLSGITFVTTGVFPQIGGGTGLNLGKDRTKKLIESFGGRVTSAISGRTSILLVGEQPGASKVSKARHANIKMMKLDELVTQLKYDIVRERLTSQPQPTMIIENFSAGFRGNAADMDSVQLAIASGTAVPSDSVEIPQSGGIIGGRGRVIPIANANPPRKPKKKTKYPTATDGTSESAKAKAKPKAKAKAKTKTKAKAKSKAKPKAKANSANLQPKERSKRNQTASKDTVEVIDVENLGLGLGLELDMEIDIARDIDDEAEVKEEEVKAEQEPEAEEKGENINGLRRSSRKKRTNTRLND